jgi:RHH-type proline utilization regulon transcriptional repressor/proline dehydrogenase/delta 1-pyrroline-5-carboxylate dehydrogenase
MAWFGRKKSGSSTINTTAEQTFAPPVSAAGYANASSPGGFGADLESAIRAVGSEMLARARNNKAGVLSAAFYSDALMNWSMKDPNFKVQMFRFVDAFPVLRQTEDIYDHLTDYLGQPGVTVPGPIAAALSAGKLAKGIAVSAIRKQIESMAGKFIAGEDASSALPNLQRGWSDGIAFSVDLLGEACVGDSEADAYRDKYLDLINNLPGQVAGWKANPRLESDHLGAVPRTNVSVKISSLSARCDPIDPSGARRDLMKRLKPILEAAKARGVLVNFDMEQFSMKDFTIDLFMHCCEEVGFEAGMAMQAYLRSGEADARRVCEWASKKGRTVTIRLVKGAYWDYEVINAEARGWPCPVWPNKRETDACFERMARIFIDSTPKTPGVGGVKLALGSHNVRSIAAALAYVRSKGLPDNAIELQMLHGMADQLKYAASEMNLRIREYVPVGQMIPGMAYLVRRLLENTSNESWLKSGFLDNADEGKLLASPHGSSEAAAMAHKPHGTHSTTGDANTIKTAEPSASNLDRAPERHQLTDAVTIDGQALRPFYNEAFRDFSDAQQRREFEAAVRAAVVPMVKNDATVPQASEMVARAQQLFPAWRDVSVDARSKALVRFAQLMRDRRDELSGIMIKEAGKTWREADADTCEAIDFCEFYARQAPALFRRERIGKFIGELDEQLHEPRGVAVVIAPWNFPLAICCGMTVAALVTGNTVIVKPAEQTPGIARVMVDLLHQALSETLAQSEQPEAKALVKESKGLVQFCAGVGETVGAALVRDERVALIAFTGSREVGCDILHAAAPRSPFAADRAAFAAWASSPGAMVKHVVCEMGGKNALIIDTSADHDEAILAARHSAFAFQGQKCSALSRLIVVDPQGPDGPSITHFRQRLIEAVKALSIGDPINPGTDVGPVIDDDAKAKINGFIERAKTSGLKFVNLDIPQGLEAATGKAFVSPHLFWTVPDTHELAREEIFGPVLAVMHAKDFDDALRIANALPYKLTGGVYSRKPAHIERAKARFRVGNLYINRGITGALVARHPFGGFGMSGVGSKAGGREYLHHFVVPRAIAENTMRRGFAPEL